MKEETVLLGSQQQYSIIIDKSNELGSGSFACVVYTTEVSTSTKEDNQQPIAVKVIAT